MARRFKNPHAVAKKRMCLQEETRSGQLQRIDFFLMTMMQALPEDPRMMRTCLDFVRMMWKDCDKDRSQRRGSHLIVIIADVDGVEKTSCGAMREAVEFDFGKAFA